MTSACACLAGSPACRECSIGSAITVVFNFIILPRVPCQCWEAFFSQVAPLSLLPSASHFIPGADWGGTISLFFFFFQFIFCPHCEACGILVPRPGIEPIPPAVEARSLNHWTAREVLAFGYYSIGACSYWASALKCETFPPFFFFKDWLIDWLIAMLGLRFRARAFSSCGKRGPLFIAVRGPLTIVASLVAEHRLQTRRLSSCGSRA